MRLNLNLIIGFLSSLTYSLRCQPHQPESNIKQSSLYSDYNEDQSKNENTSMSKIFDTFGKNGQERYRKKIVD